MTDSILETIKKMLGIDPDYTAFDTDIIVNINSIFMVLHQLGVGPTKGFSIEDASSTWAEFLGDSTDLESVKTFIYLRVRMLFDPPSSSSVLDSMNRTCSELEWRLNVQAEQGGETTDG